jgi:hypothetical protein
LIKSFVLLGRPLNDLVALRELKEDVFICII